MATAHVDRLERLRLQQQHLAARIRRMEARERSLDRKRETRRKILLGSLLMRWCEQDPAMRARVEAALPRFLSRRVDREAFGLPPLEEDSGERSGEGNGVAGGEDSDGDIFAAGMP